MKVHLPLTAAYVIIDVKRVIAEKRLTALDVCFCPALT